MSDIDIKLMSRALKLALQGDPSPNPHAAAVLAQGEKPLAEGFHQAAGTEHAEVAAIRQAGATARGSTMYVTLEPCNHEGRTPPCVDAILAAGVRRVVVGCRDPNPNVRGGGIERLQEAGVEVELGVLEAEAKELVRPWTKFVTTGTSHLALKLALSLDGRIATRTGISKWITCNESRARVHALRAYHDAVMIGVNSVITDDPQLTVRDVPGRNPIRVVIDSKLRTPVSSQLASRAREVPTCVVTTVDGSRAAAEALESAGVSILRVPATAEGRCDMIATLRELAAREVVSVLCEGGAELAGSLLANGLADELHAFIAPVLLGPRGRPAAVDWAGPENLAEAPRIEPPRWELCGTTAYVWGPLLYPKRARATTA